MMDWEMLMHVFYWKKFYRLQKNNIRQMAVPIHLVKKRE